MFMLSVRSLCALFVGIILAMALSSSFAQTKVNSSGNGGINVIKGKVYLPSGSALDTPIDVELQSTTFGSLKLTTDASGSYAFENLSPGPYTVVVNAGEKYEIARESVLVDDSIRTPFPSQPVPRVLTVPINLQLKRTGRTEETGVINAKWVDVPKDAIHHLKKGNSLAAQRELDKAEAEFRKALEVAPTFTPAHTALGKLLLTEGKVADSINELELAVRDDATDFDARFSYGVALMESRKIDQAQKELNEAAVLDKTAATPRYYLGQIYVQKKDLDSALKEFEAARDLTGKRLFPLLHRYLGGVYVLKGRNREAVAELEVYVAQDPNAKDIDRIKQTIQDLKAKLN